MRARRARRCGRVVVSVCAEAVGWRAVGSSRVEKSQHSVSGARERSR